MAVKCPVKGYVSLMEFSYEKVTRTNVNGTAVNINIK